MFEYYDMEVCGFADAKWPKWSFWAFVEDMMELNGVNS